MLAFPAPISTTSRQLVAILGALLLPLTWQLMPSTAQPDKDFDTEKWQAARKRDLNVRLEMCPAAIRSVMGKSHKDVLHLLGEPDRDGCWLLGTQLTFGGDWHYYVGSYGYRYPPTQLELDFENAHVVSADVHDGF